MGSEFAQNKFVIYTAIFDNYDVLMDPKDFPSEIDTVCFTDNRDLQSNTWEIRYISQSMTPALTNRKLKILPHRYLPNYNYSLYVDGNIHIVNDITDLASDQFLDHSLIVPPHPKRNCVYNEAERCLSSGLASRKEVYDRLRRYDNEGFPPNYGLSENNVIFRKHNNDKIKNLMENWWDEVQKGSGRDQLSLPYLIWKHDLQYHMLEFSPRDRNQYFIIYPHMGNGSRFLWVPLIKLLNNLPIYLERTLVEYFADLNHAYRKEGIRGVSRKSLGRLMDLGK